jgi:hypothetical protein
MRKIYIFVLLMATGFSVFAQWTQNTLVNTEASTTNAATLASVNTSDGKTWMAYFKQVPAQIIMR